MEKTILAIFDGNQEVYKKVMANNSNFLSIDGKGMRLPKEIINGH
ncbi:hypothetical protein C7437_10496 [Psychrobacillus insolitus]|uniref:Uncharacterized protein n=1 Tax=Psychrobacillus insolitus TaxID=1461 RepID=A0A2W7MPH7_9BACI|nr:hypothetical protein [Psychrobacillus insolitus]PZX04584.1 hypothetical protein C7437_10496 [Psychrobacillus insolitus]